MQRLQSGLCRYRSRVDRPHDSRTAGDVSVHGWWEYESGGCTRANVTVALQAVRCREGSWGNYCWWQTVDTGRRYNMPRNARLRDRANARITCASQDRNAGFRAWVDVDIVGYADPPGKVYSEEVNRRCVPS